MRKLQIVFLNLLLCVGGRPPVILAEEFESITDDSSSETLQEEETQIAETVEQEEEPDSEKAADEYEEETNDSGFVVYEKEGDGEFRKEFDFDAAEGKTYVTVYAISDSSEVQSITAVDEFGQDAVLERGEDWVYFQKPSEGVITVHAVFSSAILVADNEFYRITAKKLDHAHCEIEEEQTVEYMRTAKITVEPDFGYKVTSITATDQSGEVITGTDGCINLYGFNFRTPVEYSLEITVEPDEEIGDGHIISGKDFHAILEEIGCENIKSFMRYPSTPTPVCVSNAYDISEAQNQTALLWNHDGILYWYTTQYSMTLNEDASGMFADCVNLTDFDAEYIDTSEVNDMSSMFSGCTSLRTLNLSTWNTSSVRYAAGMFCNLPKLRRIYIGEEWDFSNVEEAEMFRDADCLMGGRGTAWTAEDNALCSVRAAHDDGGYENPGLLTPVIPGKRYEITVDENEFYHAFLKDSRGILIDSAAAGEEVSFYIECLQKESDVLDCKIYDEPGNEIPFQKDLDSIYSFEMPKSPVHLDIKITGVDAPYVDEEGNSYFVNELREFPVLTGIFTTGWYYADHDRTFETRVDVCGDVNIILKDGVTLTCNGGIHNKSGNSLTIWGQSEGTGKLYAGKQNKKAAGIGGNQKEDGGTINIHGGNLEIWGSERGAGIGGGDDGTGGNINIYGGYIEAYGGAQDSKTPKGLPHGSGAAIGGGDECDGGTINIYGGTIKAQAGYNDTNAIGNGTGAAIGGGNDASGGNINIYGGDITAYGCYGYASFLGDQGHSAAIGGGDEGGAGTIYIYGGTICAAATDDSGPSGNEAAGIGAGERGYGGSVDILGGDVTASGFHAIGEGRWKNDDPITSVAVRIGGGIGIEGFSASEYYDALKKKYTELHFKVMFEECAEYYDEEGKAHSVSDYHFIEFKDLKTGWYFVNEDTEFDYRLVIHGDVNIILKDGVTLSCKKGICNKKGSVPKSV